LGQMGDQLAKILSTGTTKEICLLLTPRLRLFLL
jgi:hypothetical protein